MRQIFPGICPLQYDCLRTFTCLCTFALVCYGLVLEFNTLRYNARRYAVPTNRKYATQARHISNMLRTPTALTTECATNSHACNKMPFVAFFLLRGIRHLRAISTPICLCVIGANQLSRITHTLVLFAWAWVYVGIHALACLVHSYVWVFRPYAPLAAI